MGAIIDLDKFIRPLGKGCTCCNPESQEPINPFADCIPATEVPTGFNLRGCSIGTRMVSDEQLSGYLDGGPALDPNAEEWWLTTWMGYAAFAASSLSLGEVPYILRDADTGAWTEGFIFPDDKDYIVQRNSLRGGWANLLICPKL